MGPTTRPTTPLLTPAGRTLLLVLGGATLYRYALLAWAGNNLYGDEAQYWLWSTSLDWGYFSKPPLLAWLIRLGTSLLGDGELGVRAVGPLLLGGAAWLLYPLGRELGMGDGAAATAAGVFGLLPGISLLGLVVTTDHPLLFLWSLALLFLARAMRTDAWRDWLGLGGSLGLGLQAKYSMSFFVLSAAVFFALAPERRPLLRSARLWAALGLAALVFAPNVWWNAAHGWAAARHVAHANVALQKVGAVSPAPGEFLASQLGVVGPLLFPALLWALWRARDRWVEDRTRLLVSFTAPVLVLMVVEAAASRAEPNWAAMAYLSGALLAVEALLAAGRARFLGLAVAVNVLLAVALGHLEALARALHVELRASRNIYARVAGWDELGRRVARHLRANPTAALMSDDRIPLAELVYYTRPWGRDPVHWHQGPGPVSTFDLARPLSAVAPGASFVFVTAFDPAPVAARFGRATLLESVRFPIAPDRDFRREVWLMEGFTGPPPGLDSR